jgi:hypothetical protein
MASQRASKLAERAAEGPNNATMKAIAQAAISPATAQAVLRHIRFLAENVSPLQIRGCPARSIFPRINV